MLLISLLNYFIGATKTPPVLNLGTFIGRPTRLILFWKHILWKVFWYYVPASLAGAIIAAWIFKELNAEWLQIFVGAFLISTIFQYRFGKKQRSFKVKKRYFIPLGFTVSILGTVIGALGPVLTPFYHNIGLEKERLIATKPQIHFLWVLPK